MGYIYIIENNINHKKYIGQTKNPTNRWKSHKNDDIKNKNLVIGRAFLKYGIENFSFNIIEECADEKMSERERFWIKKLNTCIKERNSNGYNMTYGGERLYGEENPFYNHKHSEENKNKLSHYASMRTGDKNPFYGKRHTEESKLKMSKSKIGTKWSEEQKKKHFESVSGRNNHFFGKHHTQATKDKISKANTGRVAYNAIPWVAYNEFETIEFLSNGKIMAWLKENEYIKHDEHFTMSMLKNNLKKAENKQMKFMGYYWKKSVETIESIDLNQEASRVDFEIDTESKCEDVAT